MQAVSKQPAILEHPPKLNLPIKGQKCHETFLRQWFITRLESCLLQFADRVSWKSKEIACIAIVSNFIKWCFIQWKVILAGQVWGQRSLWCQLGLKMINCFIFSFFSSSEKLKFDPDPDFINRLIPFSRDSRHASIQFSSIIISYCRSKSFESITTKRNYWITGIWYNLEYYSGAERWFGNNFERKELINHSVHYFREYTIIGTLYEYNPPLCRPLINHLNRFSPFLLPLPIIDWVTVIQLSKDAKVIFYRWVSDESSK